MRKIKVFHFSIFIDIVSPVTIADIYVKIDAQQQNAVSLVNSTLLFALILTFEFLLVRF